MQKRYLTNWKLTDFFEGGFSELKIISCRVGQGGCLLTIVIFPFVTSELKRCKNSEVC